MTTAKKPTARTAAAKAAANKEGALGYLQNKEGRVFIATAPLIKQMKKGKFGLMRITESVYIEALDNGGLTDPLPEFDDEDQGEI